MENATKALFIAAGVMMAIMILSMASYLYINLGSYVDESHQQMQITSNSKFNQRYLKYINMTEDSSGDVTINGKKYKTDFKLTIQDVITVANLAYENNREHGNENASGSDINENSLYVGVNVKINGVTQVNDIQKGINDNNSGANKYLDMDINPTDGSRGSYNYKCTNVDVEISSVTGQVYRITFH